MLCVTSNLDSRVEMEFKVKRVTRHFHSNDFFELISIQHPHAFHTHQNKNRK